MTTEELLKSLVERIERSHISREEKDSIFVAISQGLHAAVLPVLVNYMPKDKLEAFSQAPENSTVENYYVLIREALNDEKALEDIDLLVRHMLQVTEKTLKDKYIII